MTTPEQRPFVESPYPHWLRTLSFARRSLRDTRAISGATRMPPGPPPEARTERPSRPPVFVISAGWRSGSTAVQRLITASGEAFVWGEPFPTSRLLPRLQRIAAEAPVIDGRPDRVLGEGEALPSLSESWIAMRGPTAPFLTLGVQALFESVYWTPLRDTAFKTWGVKEVVATPDQIRFLMDTFTQATFVCLVRDPKAAYASFRKAVVAAVAPSGRPDAQLAYVRGPLRFSRVWSSMARTIREEASARPNVLVYRYEDIRGNQSFPSELGAQLQMELPPRAWNIWVGGSPARNKERLASVESRVVQRLTAKEAVAWGYASAG